MRLSKIWSAVLCQMKGRGCSFQSATQACHCTDQVSDAVMSAAPEPFGAELGEPALHEVHPGAVGRGEMKREPADDAGPRAGSPPCGACDVVQHDMHREFVGHAAVDEGEDRLNSRAPSPTPSCPRSRGPRRRQAPRRDWWCRDGRSRGSGVAERSASSAASGRCGRAPVIWVFSSTHKTSAASGGLHDRVQPRRAPCR